MTTYHSANPLRDLAWELLAGFVAFVRWFSRTMQAIADSHLREAVQPLLLPAPARYVQLPLL